MAFSEQGVAMLSTVLNSEKAIKVNIVGDNLIRPKKDNLGTEENGYGQTTPYTHC